MVTKCVVFFLLSYLNICKVQTQTPPKVPQLFLPSQVSMQTVQKPTQDEVPLSLKALTTAIPKSIKGGSCTETLNNILLFLAARELKQELNARPARVIKKPAPIVNTVMVTNNANKDSKELIKINKETVLDATSNAIQELLAGNYQYQTIGTNLYNPKAAYVAKKESPATIVTQKSVQSVSPIRGSNCVKITVIPNKPNVYETKNIPRTTYPNINYVGPKTVNYFDPKYGNFGVRRLANSNAGYQMINRNVYPVIPVTRVNGLLNDNDSVVVLYRPKTVTQANNCGNVVNQRASKVLVPYYISRLIR